MLRPPTTAFPAVTVAYSSDYSRVKRSDLVSMPSCVKASHEGQNCGSWPSGFHINTSAMTFAPWADGRVR